MIKTYSAFLASTVLIKILSADSYKHHKNILKK